MLMPPLIDTHCHLDFPVFDGQHRALLSRCARLSVARIVIPAVIADHWPRLMQLADMHEPLLPALGLHPCFVEHHLPDHLLELESLLAERRVCAVGEIGLDLWHGDSTLKQQSEYFEAQLALAERFQLPVLLHVRKAHEQTIALLRRRSFTQGGIVHAFSGSQQQAERYLELGFCLGVGGGVTYPRARKLRRTLAAMPDDALVLETDAPDMPLCGYQGQPNSPEKLPEVLQALAEVCQRPAEQLAEQLWRNSCRVLRLEAA
ncbi:TatD family hydrolase [Motiliproteus sediminis]|uniref:TatD family hydrolase n=1 Tax=Motiliproteus sediminis TaxID=1468178 RepID=UPI001FE5A4B8|nr:TatD family hydrolase [Motiliproteus sediminis]